MRVIPLVWVRHRITGRKAQLPETALHLFPDYVRTPQQRRVDASQSPASAPAASHTHSAPAEE